ncbi:hypothetical protein J1N35_044187 [Gossypium stocksii]|uniref:Uncharacterized protein n=1 Tax=Gossypium stocksii TaxID=47602 RepID=A0A9D3U909_9ROSI|nr:hypothetical protein J1N35_044187 [Gossypium stocksii]
MNTLMKEVEHDIPKLEDEGHYTVIEHDELDVGVQQEIRFGDRDEIVKNEEGVITLIYLGFGLGVGIKLDVEEELNLKLNESVEEPTHFLTIVLEESTKVLHDHMYYSFDVRTTVWDNTTLHGIEFVLPKVIVPWNEFWTWLGFREKWFVMWLS